MPSVNQKQSTPFNTAYLKTASITYLKLLSFKLKLQSLKLHNSKHFQISCQASKLKLFFYLCVSQTSLNISLVYFENKTKNYNCNWQRTSKYTWQAFNANFSICCLCLQCALLNIHLMSNHFYMHLIFFLNHFLPIFTPIFFLIQDPFNKKVGTLWLKVNKAVTTSVSLF